MAGSIELTTIFFAIAGGILPAIIWLFFWLNEDCHPEPKRVLVLAFFAGVFAIPAALIGEAIWEGVARLTFVTIAGINAALIIGFAFIEEFVKWLFIRLTIFWRSAYDEPVDAMVYLVTGALGFAAFENILYLVPEYGNSFFLGVTTGNLRFVGATLLHALSSGVLGFFLAHNFCKNRLHKFFGRVVGLSIATILHVIFNIVILSTNATSLEPIVILLGLSGILLIFGFDHIKRVHQKCPIAHERSEKRKNIIPIPHPRDLA